MMYQVKTFSNKEYYVDPSYELERDMSEWFQNHPDIEIIKMTQSSVTIRETHDTDIDCVDFRITILYTE
ncbi:MAG: hypothetical protein GY804_11610 [Alphaproteobacteria bacterium]|nr:hypothetical protein [Alphaproteobacteria bacterium]